MGKCYINFNFIRQSIQELFIKFNFLITNTRDNKSNNTVCIKQASKTKVTS